MKIIKAVFRFFLKILVWFFTFSICMVILYRFVPPPVTPLMIIRAFEQSFDEKRKVRISKKWMPINKISPSLVVAVISSEDQNFLNHSGFDLEAIQKARKFNKKHKGRKVRGASTISQQTAKNVFLWTGRSYLRKGLEVYFTVLIEIFWNKKRIMEVYLNVIEFGDGIYGAEAAAQEYFDKKAQSLSRNQSALMAACIPSPLRWSPAKPTPYVYRRQAWILRQMGMRKKPDFLDEN